MVHFLLPCLIFSARERKLLLPNNDGANSKQMLSRQSQPWRLRADDEYAGFLNWKNNKQYVHTAHTYINLHISYIIFGNIPIMNIWQTINSKASESNLFNHLASFQKKKQGRRGRPLPPSGLWHTSPPMPSSMPSAPPTTSSSSSCANVADSPPWYAHNHTKSYQ